MGITQNIWIAPDEITLLNSEEQIGTIVVDLSSVWSTVSRYSDIYITGVLKIPTFARDSNGTLTQTTTVINSAANFKVASLVGEQASLYTPYSGLLEIDQTRLVTAQAEVIVYEVHLV